LDLRALRRADKKHRVLRLGSQLKDDFVESQQLLRPGRELLCQFGFTKRKEHYREL